MANTRYAFVRKQTKFFLELADCIRLPPRTEHAWASTEDDMADEFDSRIIQDFAHDIAGRLTEAAIIARTADGLGQQGLSERALRSLLEVEPLLCDVTILLNAASVVRRRGSDPDD